MLVVPVYNMLLAPDATVYFQMEQLSRSSAGKGVAVGEKVIFIVAKENADRDSLGEDSFYPIGLAAKITEIGQQGYAAIATQYRVDIESVGVDVISLFNPRHGNCVWPYAVNRLQMFCVH